MRRMLIYFTSVKPLFVGFVGILFALVSWSLPPGASELLRYEQKYVNRSLDTLKIRALKNYQAQEYSPELGQFFEVKSYWIPLEKLHVFDVPEGVRSLGFSLKRTQNGQKQVLFLVHPESESFYQDLVKNADRGPRFEATATASSRTLMMWPATHPEMIFFGKLSLNKEIGGVVRTIPEGEVARSVGVSKILDVARGELPQNFDYLPEFFGVMPLGMERGGMLLRSLPPKMADGQTRIMPLFAVYTKPEDGERAPIEAMINESGIDAQQLVVDKILRPFAEQWIDLAVNNGIAIEAHAQNVLMEINAQGLPTGKFIYRDFGGFNIDLQFRRDHHLAMPTELPVISDEIKDYHQNSHDRALRQSLETYFEGGFLFGLGEELAREGHGDLTYEKLMSLFRSEIKAQLRTKGIETPEGDFYENVLISVKKARKLAHVQGLKCQQIFLAR